MRDEVVKIQTVMIDLVQRIQHLENEISVSKEHEDHKQQQQTAHEIIKSNGNHRKRKI